MDFTAKLLELKRSVDEAKAKYERAKGRLEASDKEMRDAGFETVDQLSAAIMDHELRLKDLKDKLEKDLALFEEKYGALLK
jgi:hypothetical protein